MREIRLTLKEIAQLIQLQKTKKWEWPAVFSTNSHGSIWAGTTFSRTPIEEREELRDLVPVLNRIRDLYLGQREQGGRMFIDLQGAYFKEKNGQPIQFVKFDADHLFKSLGTEQ
jgi:hypothetical protein